MDFVTLLNIASFPFFSHQQKGTASRRHSAPAPSARQLDKKLFSEIFYQAACLARTTLISQYAVAALAKNSFQNLVKQKAAASSDSELLAAFVAREIHKNRATLQF
jgi:hypothetical protein